MLQARYSVGAMIAEQSRTLCRLFLALAVYGTAISATFAADLATPNLLPGNSAVVAELRQPQAVLQHGLVLRGLAILKQSRAFQDALGNPDFDLIRDGIQHFESQLGIPLDKILDNCIGEGIWISVGEGTPPEICVIVHGRDAERVARLPAVTLSLIGRIVAGRGITLPDPTPRTHHQHTYYQLGEAFYTVAGPRWLLANREASLQGMLDRLDGRVPATTAGLPTLLNEPIADGTALRVGLDLPRIQQLPGFPAAFKWPPKEPGPVILAAGWLDLIHRSPQVTAELSLAGDSVRAHLRFPKLAGDITPGTVGYFASEPAVAAAPLLEPAQLIYSASWYRDYWKMWERRNDVPLPNEIGKLEKQLASTQDGNLGYSAIDFLRLMGPHLRFVVTRPGPSAYRVAVTDRLPNFAAVVDLRDENAFRDKVLPPIQRILGVVAITQKMISQNTQYKSAEVTVLKFTEDAAAVMNSDRVRYNFEPTYAITRGHLIVGSTAALVRNLIDELDRLQSVPANSSSTAPGPTERQIVKFDELAALVDDVHGLAVRNAVLNNGLTIAEAEQELALLKQLVAALGALRVEAGFDEQGFGYRIELPAVQK